MYLIKLIKDRNFTNDISEKIVGYKESEQEAQEYCNKKDKELNYNESMGHMYYSYEKINLIED